MSRLIVEFCKHLNFSLSFFLELTAAQLQTPAYVPTDEVFIIKSRPLKLYTPYYVPLNDFS